MRGLRRHRHFWPITVAITTLAVTMATFPAYVTWSQQFHGQTPQDRKNAISRAPLTDETQDPTTATQALAHADAVSEQRAEPDPDLVPTQSAELRPHADVPEDEYAMAGGCYAMQATSNGKWVARSSNGYVASAADAASAEPFHFQATDLGSYLMWDSGKRFIRSVFPPKVTPSKDPAKTADWTAKPSGSSFVFTLPSSKSLTVDTSGKLASATTGTPFALKLTTGCPEWPEVDVNVSGAPFGGETTHQEVRGYLDGHTHGMAFEFLGGDVHCGRPWHPYGVAAALVDCPDHQLAKGSGAVLENVTRHGTPVGTHDPVGWPTFKDWPAPDSLTHEGTYWKWLERSWRGGLRTYVNLMVDNAVLCELYPIKKHGCDEMESVRMQIADIYKLQDYIDAQYGGPGKGFFRIVKDPFQARRVVADG